MCIKYPFKKPHRGIMGSYGVLWAITINKCHYKANSDKLTGEKSIDEYIIEDPNRKNGVYDDNNDIISKNVSLTQRSKIGKRILYRQPKVKKLWFQCGTKVYSLARL